MSDAMREKIVEIIFDKQIRGVRNLPIIADAIIAALPGMVPPLMWQRNGFHYAGGHGYVVRKFNKRYTLTVRNSHGREFDDLDAAKTAAQAHHVEQIMYALGIKQEDK